MSRFLKFIIHLTVLFVVICTAALVVPPFMGVTTVIISDAEKDTNLPMGSVTYAKTTPVSELQAGDSVLIQDSNKVYRYMIRDIDNQAGVFKVKDTLDANGEESSITLRNTAPEVIFTLGYIGYLLIATQSVEGLIILGLSVLFLIILFVLSELWRKDKKSDDAGELMAAEEGGKESAVAAEREEPEFYEDLSKKELKQRRKELRRLEKDQKKVEVQKRKQVEKRKRKEAKKIARTGGFLEDLDPIEAALDIQESDQMVATDDAHKELKKEIAVVTGAEAEEVEAVQPEVSEVKAAVTEELPTEEIADAVQEEEPVEIRKMVIPMYSATELLDMAKARGEEPEIITDDISGVTLLDYSSIIIGDDTEE